MTEGNGAPRDGTAFLAFGYHTVTSVMQPGVARGVVAGDCWWAVILYDVWRPLSGWVFAKDGAPVWSEPMCWQPLIGPDGECPQGSVA